ncbi:MAG: endonuclease V [Nitrososphaerota archaeon]|nr:endonuclease V [Aigarchaeota archaeon]MDW8076249.1 endonuclease V [Nitrososphaerota archaeon]
MDLESLTYEEAVKLQSRMASMVLEYDFSENYELFCGVDVAYSGQHAIAAAVVEDKNGSVVEISKFRCAVRREYVPGLLFIREASPMLNAIKGLKNDFDVLLVDGNGRLHPRKFGIACYVGVVLDKPTIGVAKRLLCGQVKTVNGRRVVMLNDEIVGEEVSKNVYVSIGHKISLSTAVKIVKKLTRDGSLPSPILAAHKVATEESKRKG